MERIGDGKGGGTLKITISSVARRRRRKKLTRSQARKKNRRPCSPCVGGAPLRQFHTANTAITNKRTYIFTTRIPSRVEVLRACLDRVINRDKLLWTIRMIKRKNAFLLETGRREFVVKNRGENQYDRIIIIIASSFLERNQATPQNETGSPQPDYYRILERSRGFITIR